MSIKYKTTFVRNLETDQVSEYHSLADAARAMRVNPACAAVYVGKYIVQGKWWFYHQGQNERPAVRHTTPSKGRSISIYIKKATGEVIHTDTIKEAARIVRISPDTIRRILKTGESHKGIQASVTPIFQQTELVTPQWLSKKDSMMVAPYREVMYLSHKNEKNRTKRIAL